MMFRSGLVLGFLLAVPALAGAQVINGFGGMMLNGNAQLVGSTLRLTEAIGSQTGSAFEATPLPVDGDTDFHAWFQFAIYDGSGADGFTFAIQNDTNGPAAIGGGGGGLGYLGISPSIAVEFDTFDNGSKGENAIGIDLDGSVGSIASVQVTPDMEEVRPLFAWVDYDSQTDLLEVYFSDVNTQPGAPVVSATVDLAAVGGQAYVGFTAATGGATNVHDIEDFVLVWGQGVPTVPRGALLGLFLILLAVSAVTLGRGLRRTRP